MKSFKEYSMRSVGLSRPGTSKKVFPVLTRKGSDSNIGLQRGDVPLQKAMNDAGKVVRVRLTPTQIKQYITILKKKYKEYGGKDKDLLNSFTERLEQKIMDEGKSFSGKEVAKRMRAMKKSSGMSAFVGKVENMKTVTRKQLEKMFYKWPEHVADSDITKVLGEVRGN